MKAHQASIILGGSLLLVVTLAGTGYYFGITYLTATTQKLQVQLTDTAQADSDLQALAIAKARYAKNIVPLKPLIETALPRTKEQTDILAQLQRIATANGLILANVSLPSPAGLPSAISQTLPVSGVLALPVTFQITGSYVQLQAFLTQIENLSRSTTVTSLSVTRPDPKKPITYSITLNAYVKP
jgi:Tfp pilus assembly protein PilO